jgi:probable LLM family oxidoreductase
MELELGLCTFVEADRDAAAEAAGTQGPQPGRIAGLLAEARLADQLGLDVFAVGEHHRADYVVSAPAVVLTAIAAQTERIRLSSAVTVLSSDDPVRVFQQFATLDLVSNGRAEIMAGRGSFIESFPLFGQDLDDYDELFSEKLELLLAIRENERVTWSGRHRAAIHDLPVYPRPVQQPLPVWIAVGGTPQSVVRAGALGLPLALAVIGGMPERFAPLAALHREAATRAGRLGPDGSPPPFALNVHGFLAERSQQAADTFFDPYQRMMNRIGRERGFPPMDREHFEASRSLRGSLLVGSPAEMTEKILFLHEHFGFQRFLVQFTVGQVPHAALLRSIELFGTEVAPAVRKALAEQRSDRPGGVGAA